MNFDALDRSDQTPRIRLHATVVAVQHEGEPRKLHSVRIIYAHDGKLYSIKARSAIMAGGSWTTKHVVRDLRAPCLMANVAVRNWRFLYKLGISECQWFEGIGNYFALRKMAAFGPVSSSVSPDSPVVLTLKIRFSSPGLPIGEQVTRGRGELLSTSFREYEHRIREQFSMMFSGTGFDGHRDLAGIILNRWGHAYLSPQPGFFFGKDANPAPGSPLDRCFRKLSKRAVFSEISSGRPVFFSQTRRIYSQLLHDYGASPSLAGWPKLQRPDIRFLFVASAISPSAFFRFRVAAALLSSLEGCGKRPPQAEACATI